MRTVHTASWCCRYIGISFYLMHSLGFVIFVHCCGGIWIIAKCNVPPPPTLGPAVLQ